MGTAVRRPYETASMLTQTVLDQSQDSLVQRLEMIVDVETATGTMHWSDRAKYVGSTFYENRVVFPQIDRTVGEFLAGTLEFSGLQLTINNTDKRFSNILPGGADFDGWINRRVEVKIGLAELTASYITVFEGYVTDVGGFQRDTSSFTLVCRNKFDSVNVSIPNQVLTQDDFPDIEDDFLGLGAPIIYGDWTVDLRPEAPTVPAFPVNGLDPLVNASLDPVDPSVGDNPVRCVISSSPISFLDDASVTLHRGDLYYTFASSDIAVVGGTNNQIFDITQKNLVVDGNPWIYESGDEFFVKVKGVDLGAFDDNIVSQARDLLMTYGGVLSGDLDASWTYYRDKAAPAENAIASIKSRIWFQETAKVIELVASLLEQVRIEPFIDRQNMFKLSSLHFDEFEVSPAFTVKNWDVARGSFKPQIDERNNFNRAKGDFDFDPAAGQQRRSTAFFRNQAAIDQTGKVISKLITFPNLYKLSDVENQLKEIIRLTSGYTEIAEVVLTSRSFLKDLCDFMKLSIDIGSIEFDSTSQPIVGMIRQLSYTPRTMGIGLKIWLFQMINFPGYTGPTGTVGGYNAVIDQEA
jgi:hypothetical protein